ncbi:hypothetical protein HK101_003151 [Irineochytrium annulatum]|nr:hypothetical protein HK101_003151 [Irineochytrium annulatum]
MILRPSLVLPLLLLPFLAHAQLPILQQCALIASLSPLYAIPTTSVAACCSFRQNITNPKPYQLAVVCSNDSADVVSLYLAHASVGTGAQGQKGVWSALGQLTALTFVDLEDNGLVGEVPWNGFGALIRLQTLILSDNALTGSINLTNLRNLIWLNLTNNKFIGDIPDVSVLPGLQTL